MFVLGCLIYIICYLLTRFVYWIHRKIAKKESSRQVRFCLITYFGVSKAILRVYLFTSMHVLNFVFWICVICFNNGIGMIVWFRVYYFTISRKGVSWKSWLHCRFSRNSKSKWTLKWLPLDRGFFNFTFIRAKVY